MAGKADALHGVLLRQFESTCLITASQQFRFSVLAIAIDWAHGMKYILCGQASRAGYDCAPGGAVAVLAQFLHQAGSGGAMDGPIHSTAALQRGVGGVHNCVYRDFGDVTQFERSA